MLDQLHAWSLEAGDEWYAEAQAQFAALQTQAGNAADNAALVLWALLGVESATGERAVDRFATDFAGSLPEAQQAELHRIQAARPVLLEIDQVRAGVGWHATDLLRGDALFVHARRDERAPSPGDGAIGWLSETELNADFIIEPLHVPPDHVAAIELAFRTELDSQRQRRPEGDDSVLLRHALPAAYRALIDARSAAIAPRSEAVRGPRAVFYVRQAGRVRDKLNAAAGVTRVTDNRWRWDLANGVSGGKAEAAFLTVELEQVRLTLTASDDQQLVLAKRRAEDLFGTLVRHRVDLGIGAGSATAASGMDGGEPPPSHREPPIVDQTIQAFHRDLDGTMLRHEQQRALDAGSDRALAAARSGRHRIPPLAHETMAHLLPKMRDAITRCVARLREVSASAVGLTLEEVCGQAEVRDWLRSHVSTPEFAAMTLPQQSTEIDILASHLHYAFRHEYAHKKTFWVDEALAWMLSETELDIRGACLELPFDAFALAFTDAATLALARQCLAHTDDSRLRNKPLESLTIYLVRTAEAGARGRTVSAYLLFDAADGDWPYLLTRELDIRDDADLVEILTSRGPNTIPNEPDPTFRSPELEKLLHIALNAACGRTQGCMSALRADQRGPQAALLSGLPVLLGRGESGTVANCRPRQI